jgi:hypothetical protein
MKLYLAYGANTNVANMASRCPEAKYVGNVSIPNHRLVFRGVADVTPSKGNTVLCALWVISPKDEQALDGFEGFPNLYVKRYMTVRLQGKRHRVMFYVMRARSYEAEPSEKYEATLRTGYEQCGMSTEQIDRAIAHATKWREKHGAPARVGYGSWGDKKPVPPVEDVVVEEADDDAAEQMMFDWYNRTHEEK